MKVTERLPAVADEGVVHAGADRGTADSGVMRLGAEGGMETSMAEAVVRPLSDQRRAGASAGSGQLGRLRPRGRN